jgi:hypothetical protein
MTLTIVIPEADEKRITRALGTADTPATQAQLEATCRGWLAQSTTQWEQAQAAAKLTVPPLGLTA